MTTVSIVLLIVLFGLLAAGAWVWLALLSVGVVGLAVFRGMPVEKLLAQNLWNTATTESLLALPMFILMAEILFRSRLSRLMFDGLAPWAARIPGRLLHVNILGCTLFAATCGSSAATAITIGRITYGELVKRGYERATVIGSLAGAGTLGLMIPPSTIMIIYGVLSETSILKLFLAGFGPGLLLSATFALYVAIRTTAAPRLLPPHEKAYSWDDRLVSLKKLLPVMSLIAMVIGALYSGVASPTEAAVVGVCGALALTAFDRTLTARTVYNALVATALTTSMLGLITVAAVFLSVSLGFLGIPRYVAGLITDLQLGPIGLIFLLMVIYIVLGCFLEGISMVVMTLPIVLPLVVAAGYDKIWFGIFLVLVVEMAQITPPIGFNLFVLRALTGEPLTSIAMAALPYTLIMGGFVMLIAFVPQLATFTIGG
jgi:tripartite ATP-independent transporter DctM subunit